VERARRESVEEENLRANGAEASPNAEPEKPAQLALEDADVGGGPAEAEAPGTPASSPGEKKAQAVASPGIEQDEEEEENTGNYTPPVESDGSEPDQDVLEEPVSEEALSEAEEEVASGPS